ncbi:hypothetical protein [Geobacter sp.]|uniref:hypothetical protein n=1 Tax=Geobacter sp. TaxID=46610 RepID=UPI00263876A9|nr:hypothetical protein [Geobacter sp.]
MSGKVSKYLTVLAAVSLAAGLAGCGSGNKSGSALLGDVAKVSEASCAQCHSTAVDHIAGTKIYDAYLASKHFTNSGETVGCQDCHGGGAQHNGVGPLPYPNPDSAGICLNCHTEEDNLLPAAHFATYTSAVHPAQYVSANYEKSCTSCHDPHKADKGIGQEHTDWAASGHGNVNGPAWSDEDFKENVSCIRCHTSTGFIDYVQSNFTLPTQTWASASDKSFEVLTCKACHTDYNFKNRVRPVGAFTAPYNGGQSPATFPSVGQSNLCIPCHAGRESGDTVNAVTNFTNSSFKNSHYLAAAGLMYMKAGFINFTSLDATIGSSTYGKTLLPDDASTPGGIAGGVTSKHRKLGTPAINGNSPFVAGFLDSEGPCVTCHLNGVGVTPRTSSHTLAINADAFTQVCVNCHTSEGGTPLDGTNFTTVFLEPQKEVFQNALKLAATVLQTKWGIKYDSSTYPYFYDLNNGNKAVKDWTRGTGNQAFGKKIMGACFNINLLTKDPAAYVHARTYARRLIYDSIDFLDDGAMNLSVGATALATDPTNYGKGAAAYTDGTLTTLSPGTTESMVYLIGWSRTTGAWSTPERP